jgi:hypothetical protein
MCLTRDDLSQSSSYRRRTSHGIVNLLSAEALMRQEGVSPHGD